MSALSVEERLHALEQEIARMKAKVVSSGKYDTPWLDRIAGAFEKNADFKEAMRLGEISAFFETEVQEIQRDVSGGIHGRA